MKLSGTSVAEALGRAISIIRRLSLRRLLASQPLSGRLAFLVAAIAILIPTALLAAFDGTAAPVAVAPYVPFMLISAILLNWWSASLVALASAMIDDAFFVGTPPSLLEGPADMFMVGAFLIVAAIVFGFV